jgi:anti-anti-sigma regulatory factor
MRTGRGGRLGGRGGAVTLGADTQVTDLSVNDHACLTFGEPEELCDLTAAFVRDGLADGLRVVWLSDTPQVAVAELGRRGLRPAEGGGHVAVVGSEEGLLCGQSFVLDRAVGWLRDQVAVSRQEGFRGLRIALDMGWALRPVSGIEQLPVFEREIAEVVGDAALSVLCQYDRERFDPVTLASITRFHTRSVAAATYHHDPLLRICRQYAPPGIRLAGQIDLQAEDALVLALTEALRVDGDITVNMAELGFIDVSAARVIIDAARGLTGPRRMILRCHPAIESRFVLLGAADLPNVRVTGP